MAFSLSGMDKLILGVDKVLQTLAPGASTESRPSPANTFQSTELDAEQSKHIAGLMRINHTGEVCAQALYQGQALTAKQAGVREDMQHAAQEEVDHLVWCEQRLADLGSQPSLLNPLFYGASFTIGAVAGAISDRLSLGFVAATEDQVCAHLEAHLAQLPEHDQKSRAILEQMLTDEKKHGEAALEAGGIPFAPEVKSAMTLLSQVMTKTTYHI